MFKKWPATFTKNVLLGLSLAPSVILHSLRYTVQGKELVKLKIKPSNFQPTLSWIIFTPLYKNINKHGSTLRLKHSTYRHCIRENSWAEQSAHWHTTGKGWSEPQSSCHHRLHQRSTTNKTRANSWQLVTRERLSADWNSEVEATRWGESPPLPRSGGGLDQRGDVCRGLCNWNRY